MDARSVAALGDLLGAPVRHLLPVGGGCVADAQRVELVDGRIVFAKSGARLPEGLLDVEAEGLRWLGAAGRDRDDDRDGGGLAVPRVLATSDDPPLLVIEWIEGGPSRPDTPERLGRGLAALHGAGADAFGWHRDGFIGPLPQRNTPEADEWAPFWFEHRIEPLARRAADRGSLPASAPALVDRLGGRVTDLAGPAEPPARVHGDLWSGNVLVGADGRPWIIDPAAYGGHREVDLAMYSLFGSPPPAFFAAYQDVSPLAEGWQDRLPLWRLEPLLVHASLFGAGYGAQATEILRRLT